MHLAKPNARIYEEVIRQANIHPDETLFMKKGKEHGATVKNGLEMLLLQAFASWDFWQEEK